MAAVAVAMLGATYLAAPAYAEEIFSETFAEERTTAGAWQAPRVEGRLPACLTAATESAPDSLPACQNVIDGEKEADPVGEGVAQITDTRMHDRGAILLDRNIDARRGLDIKFDFFQWGGRQWRANDDDNPPRGGDGISFFLVDGEQREIEVGESGGRLGYKGIPGAFIGVGFDAFGNFSTQSPEEFSTGPGLSPNHVVLRGSDRTDYAYIDGKESPAPLALDDATDREPARRSVEMAVTTEGLFGLQIDYHDGNGPQVIFEDVDLDEIRGQDDLPNSIKLGFAASTGQATAFHEIQGFEVHALDPNLKIEASGEDEIEPGESGSVTLNVSNADMAGPTTGDVTVTYESPDGLTPTDAGGDGWECEVEGQTVTCTRPGDLRPGGEAPPIEVQYDAADDASGELTGNATVDTPNEADPDDNTDDHTVTVPERTPGPDLYTETGGDTELPPGGEGEAVVTVGNKDGAGPTDDTVTATYEAPEGIEVTGAEGDGWECEHDDKTVTCTRPGTGDDALPGGEEYPPVNVGLRVPDDAEPGDREGTANVDTEGDTDPDNNESPAPLTVTEPDDPYGDEEPDPYQTPRPDPYESENELEVNIESDPNPYKPGKPYKYTVTAENKGKDDAKGAELTADFPELWESIKWKCEASGGAECPSETGVGDIDETVDLPAGGKLTYTVVCRMPKKSTATYDATATVTLEGSNCPPDRPCTSEDSNSPATRDARMALPGIYTWMPA